MFPRNEYFDTLELEDLENGEARMLQGMSSILLMMFDNCEFLMQYVRYVLELRRNLLSVSMFVGLSHVTSFEHGVMKISHDTKINAPKCVVNTC